MPTVPTPGRGPRSATAAPYPQSDTAPVGTPPIPGPKAVPALATGIALVLVVLVLGLLTKIKAVSRFDLRFDTHLAHHDRSSTLTSIAKAVTTIATPETVGIAAMILIPAALLLTRRRRAALSTFCLIAGAFALTEIAKKLISEPRPPIILQALKADSGGSFPSGHTTVAAAIALSLTLIATTQTWRVTAAILGGLYALAVAVSRVYLADHYPLDVIGAILAAGAALLIVTGLDRLPPLQPRLSRLDQPRTRRDA